MNFHVSVAGNGAFPHCRKIEYSRLFEWKWEMSALQETIISTSVLVELVHVRISENMGVHVDLDGNGACPDFRNDHMT